MRMKGWSCNINMQSIACGNLDLSEKSINGSSVSFILALWLRLTYHNDSSQIDSFKDFHLLQYAILLHSILDMLI